MAGRVPWHLALVKWHLMFVSGGWPHTTLDNTATTIYSSRHRTAPTPDRERRRVGKTMVPLLLVLLVVALLFGAGTAVHALWWVAVIALALWVVGFVAR